VRAGTPAPDVSTPANLRRAILQAASLGYADPARGSEPGRHLTHVLASMGILPLLTPKTTLFPDGRRALEAVATGHVALAVAPITEIRGVDGVALGGPLPGDLQLVVVYGAGVMTRSVAPEVALAFLAHLTSAEARAQFTAGGVETAD
jgi:molybdate transport system substrate-binding protein